jgi:hypothetical protein
MRRKPAKPPVWRNLSSSALDEKRLTTSHGKRVFAKYSGGDSHENVEIVRRFIDAWQRGSDAMIEFLDRDIEWAPVEESHMPSHGHEGARRLREGWLDNWEEHQLDVEEMLDKGGSGRRRHASSRARKAQRS